MVALSLTKFLRAILLRNMDWSFVVLSSTLFTSFFTTTLHCTDRGDLPLSSST